MNPRLLDLFCGAGGAAMGYHRAGFEVVGVDIEPHPDFPFEFIQADAIEVLKDRAFLASFDARHASPPCQAYSTMTASHSRANHPDLIDPVRNALRTLQLPYVIENVEGARRRLDHPIRICGSTLGLGVRRHRYFEANLFLVGTPCAHNLVDTPWGVYGDHGETHLYMRPSGGPRGRKARDLAHAQQVMGIDWITNWDDLADAIPPAYTQFIGEQLMSALEDRITL